MNVSVTREGNDATLKISVSAKLTKALNRLWQGLRTR